MTTPYADLPLSVPTPARPRIRIVTFPEDDDQFALDVHEAQARYDGPAAGAASVIANYLISRYPGIKISHQNRLALADPTSRTLYAYRDGNYGRSVARR